MEKSSILLLEPVGNACMKFEAVDLFWHVWQFSFSFFVKSYVLKYLQLSHTFLAVRCMIPQNLTVTATGKRSLSVSWEPPLFMGKLASLLCYKILYAPAHGKNNEVSLIAVH